MKWKNLWEAMPQEGFRAKKNAFGAGSKHYIKF